MHATGVVNHCNCRVLPMFLVAVVPKTSTKTDSLANLVSRSSAQKSVLT